MSLETFQEAAEQAYRGFVNGEELYVATTGTVDWIRFFAWRQETNRNYFTNPNLKPSGSMVEVRRNFCRFPLLEVGSPPNWAANGATVVDVAAGIQLTRSSGTSSNTSLFYEWTPTTAILSGPASARYRVTVPAGAPALTLRTSIHWGTAGWGVDGAAVTINPGETRDLVIENDVAPAGATYCRPTLRSAASLPAGASFIVHDAPVLEAGETVGAPFAPGLTPPDTLAVWSGPVNASPSIMYGWP